MRLIGAFLLGAILLSSGCNSGTDYMVPYKSVAPFHPTDPNELLIELTEGLPEGTEIRRFVYHQRKTEMRGLVLVKGSRARNAVGDAIRHSPRLSMTGRGAEEVDSLRESLICFCSEPPFVPGNPQELLAELRRGLPPEIKPAVLRSKRGDDGTTLWIIVRGNFGKEATKYAVWQNPHLKLLQVENAPPFPHLSFRLLALLSGKSTDRQPHN